MKKLTLITVLSFALFGCKTESPKEETVVINLDSVSNNISSDSTKIDSVKVDSTELTINPIK